MCIRYQNCIKSYLYHSNLYKNYILKTFSFFFFLNQTHSYVRESVTMMNT